MQENEVKTTDAPIAEEAARRDWLGSLAGLAIVFGGMAILYTVFKEAWSMFAVPPIVAMKIQPGKPVDLASAFNAIIGVVVKIFLLLIMAWLGSVIANRGIFLYSQSKPGPKS